MSLTRVPTACQDLGGYTRIPDAVMQLDLTPREEQCLLRLLRYRRSGGPIFPRVRVLAVDMRCSVRTVQRAIRGLEAKRVIVVEGRYRADESQTSNLYVPGPVLAPLLSAMDALVVGRPYDDRRPPVTAWTGRKRQDPGKQSKGGRSAYRPAVTAHDFVGSAYGRPNVHAP
jgi:hypothetical protein